jgi:class 3 adenylate cyclase
MARFARDILFKMRELVQQLEVVLGPDTADLSVRVGIHSGAVTGGVLRGDKARFQLFGDTVNTASRIESSGLPDKIQVSEETANLLIGAGKQHWVELRDELVVAKGKGELKTYWLVTQPASDAVSTSSDKFDAAQRAQREASIDKALDDGEGKSGPNRSRTDRLIEWNCGKPRCSSYHCSLDLSSPN